MSGLLELIGSNIIEKNGTKVNVADLGAPGKTLGIYFSAHWCPPCRNFTPKLAELYEKLKSRPEGQNMDIVFVSSDKSQSDFDNYWGSMPWLALEYSDRDKKNELAQKFGVTGIPCLVVVDNMGKLITKDGRHHACCDQEGAHWPWRT